MKKQNPLFSYTVITVIFLIFTTTFISAQVGINTITPANGSILDIESSEKGIMIPRMDITDLTTIAPVTGITGPVEEAAAEGLMVYNTFAGTGTGFHFWNGTDWTLVGRPAEPAIDSVTLNTDQTLTSSAFTDVPGMSLTFVARKTTVTILLTGSGQSTDIAMSLGSFRVFNVTSNTIIGGTLNNMQIFDDVFGIFPGWSISFSKPLTGLVIGQTYEIKVQGAVAVAVSSGANPSLNILPTTFPSTHHLTLSVQQ